MWFPAFLGALLAYYGAPYVDTIILLVAFSCFQATVEVVLGRKIVGTGLSDYQFYLAYIKWAGYGTKSPWFRYVIETTIFWSLFGMTVFGAVLACKSVFKELAASLF